MKEKKFSDFEIEEKTSGGAVFEQGVKQSKEHKAIRRMAEPLMKSGYGDYLIRLLTIDEYIYG